MELSVANERAVKEAIFYTAIKDGYLSEFNNSDALEIVAHERQAGVARIYVTNTGKTNDQRMDLNIELNLYSGLITIENFRNKDAENNKSYWDLSTMVLARKYPELGLLDNGVRTDEKGNKLYSWSTYYNPNTNESFVYKQSGKIDTSKDIDFQENDRPKGALISSADNALIEHLQSLPQEPISEEIRADAIKQIESCGFKGVSITGTDSYKVDGEPIIFAYAKDEQGNTFNVTYRPENGCRVYIREGGEEKYTSSVSVISEITDLEKHATNFEEMGRSKENNTRPRANVNNSVLSPTPLQMLVMWTELEPELKAKFAKDPYSLGDFEGYRCSAGVLTCGFGSTGAEYQSRMSVDEAFEAMNKHIDFQRASLRKQIGGNDFDKLLPREQDALTSLGYNTGRIGDGLVSLVREYANNPSDENRDKVTDKMMEYCKYRPSKGAPLQVLSGLENRREFEVAVFKGEIDELSQKSLHWLVPASIGAKTRQQLKEFCNSADDNSKDSASLGTDLKNQGVSDKIPGSIPQEVMDLALVQTQSKGANLS